MPQTSDLPPLSAFSIARDVSIHEYPVEASIRSALPLVEEFVVNVGSSRDDTRERMASLALEHPKVRLFHRDWEDEGGVYRSLSGETNRALERCRHDWALYLQADEVLHEDDLPALRRAVARADADDRVEGLLFDYLHFYGSPDWLLTGRRTYRREVRVIRGSAGVRSVRDAQGFRVGSEGRKPRVIRSGARIFHYGYVKSLEGVREKKRLWADHFGQDASEAVSYRFKRHPGLRRFEGEHPRAARPWLAERRWDFRPEDAREPELTLEEMRVRVSDWIEGLTGRRLFEHRNYQLIE